MAAKAGCWLDISLPDSVKQHPINARYQHMADLQELSTEENFMERFWDCWVGLLAEKEGMEKCLGVAQLDRDWNSLCHT